MKAGIQPPRLPLRLPGRPEGRHEGAQLEAHAEYLAALPWHPVPSEFIPGMTAQGGAVLGVEHAMLFRRYEL